MLNIVKTILFFIVIFISVSLFSQDEDIAYGEKVVLELVNRERTGRGLKKLEMEDSLVVSARKHSAEMRDLGFFSHVSPVKERENPLIRIRNEGVTDRTVGENLGAYHSEKKFDMKTSALKVHDILMHSPEHKKEILGDFNLVGIGIVKGKRGGMPGIWVTQNFIKRLLEIDELKITEKENKYVVSISGRTLERAPIAVVVNRDFISKLEYDADGRFSTQFEVEKNGRTYTVDLAIYREKSKGKAMSRSYTVRNKFYINTKKPADESMEFHGE